MQGMFFPDFVRIFYSKLTCVEGVLISNVKGVEILINAFVWLNIVELKLEGEFGLDIEIF